MSKNLSATKSHSEAKPTAVSVMTMLLKSYLNSRSRKKAVGVHLESLKKSSPMSREEVALRIKEGRVAEMSDVHAGL